MSAREFALQLDKEYAETVGGGLTRFLQKITFELHEAIVMKTPVDTGAARASWNVSIGQPQYAIKGSVAAVIGLTKPDDIYITNAMEYISALENGHSAQAPHGMVALSIAEIETKYSRAA